MNKTLSILSAICMGVALAPLMPILWLNVPGLKNFLSSIDNAQFVVGAPLGFCLGFFLALFLNKRWNWGRVGSIVGIFAFMIAMVSEVIFACMIMQTTGWDGFYWIGAFIICLFVIVSALGLIFSGLFAHLGRKISFAPSSIP